jgi:hypothetical protein
VGEPNDVVRRAWSAAIIRARYSDPRMIALAANTQHTFHNWSTYVETEHPRAALEQTGALWYLPDES